MILTGLITGITVIIGLMVVLGVIYHVAKAKFKRFTNSFLVSPDKNTPSAAALLCQNVANIFGTEISHSLKATFLGVQSGETRGEKSLAADFLADTNPLLNVVMSAFPAVAKRIRKNPELAGIAVDMFSKLKLKTQSPAAAGPAGDGGISYKPY